MPWGIDPGRFLVAGGRRDRAAGETNRYVVFMAAVAGEIIKGFHVAQEACRILRKLLASTSSWS